MGTEDNAHFNVNKVGSEEKSLGDQITDIKNILANITVLQEEQEKESIDRRLKLEIKFQEEKLKQEKKVAEKIAKLEAAGKKEKAEQKKKDNEDYLKRLEKRYDKELEWAEKAEKKKALIAERESLKQQNKQNANTALLKGSTPQQRLAALGNLYKDGYSDMGVAGGITNIINGLADTIADIGKQLMTTVDQIAGYKTKIDTRLQGSKLATKKGSYWDQLSSNITSNIGANPLVKQSDVSANLQSMISQGIAFNVEQRAFLQTVKDKIADTFDANNGVLRRLIRIQQEDTTASRLGMESALNSFLNNMYETTEYMGSIADGIKTNLEDSMALMTAKDAVGYEYQVQKWLGSMYSTGLSSSALSSISSALGGVASGKISSLTSGGSGNLIAMAASSAGMSLANILANGLDESSTNKLMQAMVTYLSGIYDESKGNRVVQQQLAEVYGISAADLKAIASMSSDIGAISSSSVNYKGGLAQLRNMMSSMGSRVSTGAKLANTWDNFKYGTAAGIANSPTLYFMSKMSGLLDSVAGGIEFSLPTVMGTGMSAQTFNVADLMMTGALGTSLLGNLGSLLGGLSGFGSGGATSMANKYGIYNGTTVTRGKGSSNITLSGGSNFSESGYVGNASSGDVYNKTMTDTSDSANSQTANAVENEQSDVTNKVINESISDIYTLLQNVTNGTLRLHVTTKIEDTGIMGAALGGV